jgi:NADH-quinone oxidoreductase subunit L
MTLPLSVLAIGAIAIGALLGIPPEGGSVHQYLHGVADTTHFDGVGDPPTLVLAIISSVVALAGIGLAVVAYRMGVPLPAAAKRLLPGAEAIFQRKWFMDHIGDGLIVTTARATAVISWGFDVGVVDGLVNASGEVTQRLSRQLRRLQTGQAQNYALLMVAGIILVIGGLMIFTGNAT